MTSSLRSVSRDDLSCLLNEGVYVTRHALDRLREHYPDTGIRGALRLLERATGIDPGLAAAFLGRSPNGVRDRYFMSADRRGIFTVAHSREGCSFPWALVTYLRFSAYQQEVANRLMEAA